MRVSPRFVTRAGTVAAAVAVLLGSVLAAPSSAASAASAASTCPTGLFAFHATLSNGSFVIGDRVKTSGGGATLCGEITAGAGGLTPVVDPANVSFTGGSTKLAGLDVPTTVKTTGDLTGTTTLNPDGTISASFSTSVVVTTTVLGNSCSIPVDLTLTTGPSGSMSGKPLTLSGSTFTGRLVAGDFAVPKIRSSRTCNPVIAVLANGLLGLPLKKGRSQVSYDLAFTLGN